jgi:prepilin-type N-terminal cleavage/methylation domain-containing protein
MSQYRGTPERLHKRTAMRENRKECGFTLLELMMAIMIMSIMTLLSFFAFDAVVQSWHAGIEMSDSMQQVDYVMNEIESGLRSAYFSTTVKKDDEKGLAFVKDGEGAEARDSLEWMKLGRAFVGKLKAQDGKTEIAEMPHRVRIYVSEGDRNSDEPAGLMAKAWSNDFRDTDKEEFDIEKDVKPILISPRVTAMECKVLKEPPDKDAKEVKWEEEWTSSNALPYKVSVTLYLQPVKEGDDPIIVARDIEIPVWKYSQNPSTDKSGSNKTGTGTTTTGGGNGGNSGIPGGNNGIRNGNRGGGNNNGGGMPGGGRGGNGFGGRGGGMPPPGGAPIMPMGGPR